MKIESIRVLNGPNIFHYRPVITMEIDLQEYAEVSSDSVEGFNSRLVEILPGLKTHHCSPGYEGGFLERLERGTYFAHIIEHIALELSELSGIGVTYGKSIYNGKEGHYKIIVRYKCDKGMTYLLKSAVELIHAVYHSQAFDLKTCLENAKDIIADAKLGPSTQAIVDAAKKRGIPWKRLNDQSLIQLGHGKKRKFIQATTSSNTSNIGVEIAQDKFLTKELLQQSFIPVPRGKTVRDFEEALAFAQNLGRPVVIKPLDGNHGRGITLNLANADEIKYAYELAREHSSEILVEECLYGNDYRIVCVDGKLVAASHRTPAFIIGDGVNSIHRLIDIENENPLRGDGHEKPLTRIVRNMEMITTLSKNGFLLSDIPAKDQIVHLRQTANLSTGGCAIDVTDEIHPEIRTLCERAARIVGLDICGIDLIAEDITEASSNQRLGIVEINAGPGIRMHHHPSKGLARDVGSAIIDSMFKGNNGRIPIVAITGTNGKTTVTRLLSSIFTANGNTVGSTTSEGIYIGNELVEAGDTTGPISAGCILSDPSVDVAVLETARGGIVRRGLGFDKCDVGIFTNARLDHIGQDNIEGIDDIIKIKSLIIEQVRPGGAVILNADCNAVMSIMDNERLNLKSKKVTLLTLDKNNVAFKKHIKAGGHGYYYDRNNIVEVMGDYESIIAKASDFPITLNATALFHVSNAMAAIAAAHALNVSDQTIVKALESFDQERNPGRTNLYRISEGYLMADYGHNPDALESLGLMISKWNVKKVTGVLTAPGDRADELVRMLGVEAGRIFDKVIIREDEDLRGREVNEIASLLKDAVKIGGRAKECVIELDSRASLERALDEMEKGELVIYFYDDLKIVREVLAEKPVSQFLPKSLFESHEERSLGGDALWPQFSY